MSARQRTLWPAHDPVYARTPPNGSLADYYQVAHRLTTAHLASWILRGTFTGRDYRAWMLAHREPAS